MKHQRQLATSTMHLAQELLTYNTVQWWFKKSCKGDKRLEDEHNCWPSEVDGENWESSSKLILLQLFEKLPKNSALTILQSFSIWSKLERCKSSKSGCLISWPEIKKIVSLKCLLLLFCATTMNHFSIRLQNATKSGLYTTTGDDHFNSWTEKKPKALPKANLHQKILWLLFGGLLLVWPTTAFRIPVKLLHLRIMLSKLIRRTEICSPCSWHCSTERAQFFPMTMSNHALKTWTNWTMKFCLLQHIHLSPTDYHFFKHLDNFSRENASTISRIQKMHSKSSLNPQLQIFMPQW